MLDLVGNPDFWFSHVTAHIFFQFVGMIPSNPDVDHVYSYTLHSLIPYANYTVSLSAKPVTSRGDWYWSEPETITLTTDSDG